MSFRFENRGVLRVHHQNRVRNCLLFLEKYLMRLFFQNLQVLIYLLLQFVIVKMWQGYIVILQKHDEKIQYLRHLLLVLIELSLW